MDGREKIMMRGKVFKKIVVFLLATTLVAALTACAGAKTTDSGKAEGTKKIVFAYRNNGNWPVTGEDDKGNPTGYDIEVLREVDKLLDDYEFEYIGTSYDDAYIL